jgi:hypothetical protein
VAAACHKATNSAYSVSHGDRARGNIRNLEEGMHVLTTLGKLFLSDKEIQNQKQSRAADKSTVKGSACIFVYNKAAKCFDVIKRLEKYCGEISEKDSSHSYVKTMVLKLCAYLCFISHNSEHKERGYNGKAQADKVEIYARQDLFGIHYVKLPLYKHYTQ